MAAPLLLLILASLIDDAFSTYLRLEATPKEDAAFATFVSDYGREYRKGSDEYRNRLGIYIRRSREAEQHNSKFGVTWSVAVNRFSDRTDDELHYFYGYKDLVNPTSPNSATGTGVLTNTGNVSGSSNIQVSGSVRTARGDANPAAITVATTVDWNGYFKKKIGKDLEVPDQKQCGSCWAVTTTNVLNIWDQIVNERSPTESGFSAQEFVNCVPNPRKCGGTGGCEGATVELAMDWALKVGLSRLNALPYEARDNTQKCLKPCASLEDPKHPCKAEMEGGGASFGLVGWNMLPRNKVLPLRQAVMAGPVGVSVAAGPIFKYGKGIFGGCKGSDNVNHAVTLMGYGAESEKGYWQIMNSWGSGWGEDGYIRMLRETDDHAEEAKCGIDKKPIEGTACTGGPSQVRTCGMCGILYDTVRPYFSGKGVASNDGEGANMSDAELNSSTNLDEHIEWQSVAAPETE